MKIKFNLPIPPFSVNKMHSKDKTFKSAEYRHWETAALQCLRAKSIQDKLAEFRASFDQTTQALFVKFTYIFPHDKLINKAGGISSRAQDLSNVEKPLLDLICLPRYHVQPVPWGAPNLNIDDKHVLRLTSEKRIGTAYSTQITICTIAMPNLPSQTAGP